MNILLRTLLTGLLLWAFALQAAPTFPALSGRVVDEAGLLSDAQVQQLTQQLEEFENRTTIQLVVVSLNSLQDETIEEYGYQLGRHWGIGQQGKDNGVLLIVAPNERKVRIEVGYGLEGDLPDATASNIIQNHILPDFKLGDMAAGILAGSQGIMTELTGEPQPEPQVEYLNFFEQAILLIFLQAMFFFPIFIICKIIGGVCQFMQSDDDAIQSSRSSRGSRNNSSWRSSSSRSSSSSSSSSSSRSSGGGSFGGGGASGSW